MQQRLDNPFVVGGPVRPEKFVGRSDLIDRLIHRIRTRQNSAIVGGAKIGKTSIFRFLNIPQNLERMRDPSNPDEQIVTILIDFQMISSSYTPAEFWKHISKRMLNAVTQPNIRETIQDFIKQEDFSAPSIATLFEDLSLADYRFVLFLDELDYITGLKNLAVPDFLGALRSLTSVSEAFQVVVSVRHPLSELNAATQHLNPNGSPYFNTLLEHHVGIFSEEEAAALLAWGDECGFTGADKQLILKLAGLHPYRLQMAASLLYDLKGDEGLSPREMQLQLIDRFTESIDTHFSDVWGRLQEQAKIALAIMALDENDHSVGEKEFASNVKDVVKRYSSFLELLEDNGLVMQSVEGSRIAAQILTVWLSKKIASTAEADGAVTFDNWIYGQEVTVLNVTKGQRDWIVDRVRELPKDWIPRLATKIMTGFVL